MKGVAHDRKGCGDDVGWQRQDVLHAIASNSCLFLGSEFTGQIYADWPIDLRLPRPQNGRTTEFVAELWDMQPNG